MHRVKWNSKRPNCVHTCVSLNQIYQVENFQHFFLRCWPTREPFTKHLSQHNYLQHESGLHPESPDSAPCLALLVLTLAPIPTAYLLPLFWKLLNLFSNKLFTLIPRFLTFHLTCSQHHWSQITGGPESLCELFLKVRSTRGRLCHEWQVCLFPVAAVRVCKPRGLTQCEFIIL